MLKKRYNPNAVGLRVLSNEKMNEINRIEIYSIERHGRKIIDLILVNNIKLLAYNPKLRNHFHHTFVIMWEDEILL